MKKRTLGEKLIAISGIVAVIISILTLVMAVISAKWRFYVLLDIPKIFLHICLFLMGYWSRVHEDMKMRTLLIGGAVGVALSGYIFFENIGVFITLRTGIYLLALPVTVLFLVGVILRGKQKD